METPVREQVRGMRRKYTSEEKKQLLANLDLEVAHRTRQYEESLVQMLENFRNHHEGLVLRVPKLVRNITMAEFADKYDGDINECLRGLQRERQGGEPTLDPALKKRKWIDTEDALICGTGDAESSTRATKAARLASPVKMEAANYLKARLKTPRTNRTARHAKHPNAPPSAAKLRAGFRDASPPKKPPSSRPPSSNIFDPRLPKTPAYPRAPRRNESLLSINGSPLANPFDFTAIPETILEDDGDRPLRPMRSQSIFIRRDPSLAVPRTQDSNNPQSRPPSQASSIPNRSRSPSRTAHSSSGSSSSIPSIESFSSNQPSAFMRVPTKDGLLLEFDPLLTAPEELDALEGITDSAKKQVKEDMTKLVQAALARWKI